MDDKDVITIKKEPRPDEIDCLLYHKNCADGFMSAVICYRLLKSQGLENKCVFLGCDYNEKKLPDVTGKNVAVFDFSFPLESIQLLKKQSNSFILMDHHKKARDMIEGEPNCYFDMTRSGAALAWQFFHGKDSEMPLPVLYVEDRDLWTWRLPDSRAYSSGAFNSLDVVNTNIVPPEKPMVDPKLPDVVPLSITKKSIKKQNGNDKYVKKAVTPAAPVEVIPSKLDFSVFETWCRLFDDESYVKQLIEDGKKSIMWQNKQVMRQAKWAKSYDFFGYKTGLIETKEAPSEYGEGVLKAHPEYDLVIVWDWDDWKEWYSCHLRSRNQDPNSPDCDLLARKFNGGGHKNSAAFKYIPRPTCGTIRDVLMLAHEMHQTELKELEILCLDNNEEYESTEVVMTETGLQLLDEVKDTYVEEKKTKRKDNVLTTNKKSDNAKIVDKKRRKTTA